jgi:hypothetical protein
MLIARTDASARPSFRPAAVAVAAAAFLAAAGALWWRFGEAVYATSIVNALLACF